MSQDRCRFCDAPLVHVFADLGATPLVMQVRAKATLLETDGRRFVFSVEVSDAKEKVAEARHERFLVNDLAKFLARAMKKAQEPGTGSAEKS